VKCSASAQTEKGELPEKALSECPTKPGMKDEGDKSVVKLTISSHGNVPVVG
jgi:hypothetical protein